MKIKTQADIDSAQSAEDQTYRERTVEALRIIRVGGYPSGNAAKWRLHAYRNRTNPEFIALIDSQADRFGIS